MFLLAGTKCVPQCPPGLLTNVINGDCLTVCPDGTYEDTADDSCRRTEHDLRRQRPLLIVFAACDARCATCVGPAADQCTGCPAGTFLNGSVCLSLCPNGTYGRENPNECVEICPPGTYPRESDRTCQGRRERLSMLKLSLTLLQECRRSSDSCRT